MGVTVRYNTPEAKAKAKAAGRLVYPKPTKLTKTPPQKQLSRGKMVERKQTKY